MTGAPRDAIGLSERLLAEIGQPVIYRNDAVLREAATALDALQARVKELERESDGYKRLYNDEVVERLRAEKQRDAAESSATSAEQERDALRKTLRIERDCSLNETRLKDKYKRERDEALERLKPFAKAGELFQTREPGDYDQCVYAPAAGSEYNLTADHLRAARDLVRRLAAEIEKEGNNA